MKNPRKKPSRLEGWDDESAEDTGPTTGILAVVERADVRVLTEEAVRHIPDVSFTTNAHAGFAIDASSSPDLLLLECRVMSGFEDLELVRRARQNRPLMPISVLSVNGDEEFVLAA